jgi:hypothetical protein
MHGLTVKGVDLMGDTVMAAQDREGNIWAGVNYLCNALGMSKGQRDKQVQKVQKDEVLKQGCFRLEAGVFDPANEAIALRIDFIPLWLAKIVITDKTKQENPGLAEKLLQYQLKAKDILADAFLPNQQTELANANPVDVPLGELASYLKVIDKAAVRQNTPPHKIMEALKMVSEQFGVRLPEDFVRVPEYEQLTIESMGK